MPALLKGYEMSVLLGESQSTIPPIEQDCFDKIEFLQRNGIGTKDWYELPRDVQFNRLHWVVGNTPLEDTVLPNGITSFLKLELDNPSGSHYDRAYLNTIEHLESIGYLQPGDELRDITSGSAGISLALIGGLLGYKVRIITPSELPEARIFPMQFFGAEVISSGSGYVPGSSDMQVGEILALRDDPSWLESRPVDRSGRSFLFEKDVERICYLNHSENELSPLAFKAIADEVIAQKPKVTDLILAEGNWTTIAGIVRRVRELKPGVKIISYRGETSGGITENYGTNVPDVPIRFFDESLVDERVVVTNEQRDTMREIAPHLGNSSLMGLLVAQQVTDNNRDAVAVSIAYDSSLRY